MTTQCPICRGPELRAVTVPRQLAASDGAALTYAEELLECSSCHERFFTHAQALTSSRNRAAALRTHQRLLTPAEIRNIRTRFALSQAGLEDLLGVGAKTVVRWERGTVCQSRAVDTLLRLLEYFGPAVFDCVAEGRTGAPAEERTSGHADQPEDGRAGARPRRPT
jgi:HTH-type transcriptional regulator/antitoxin MqsA